MPKQGFVAVDIRKLHQLAESLKQTPELQIGVFEGKATRKKGEMTNADLAKIHEFGSPKHGLPARSILRIPLSDHRQEIMGVCKGQAYKLLVATGPVELYKMIGAAAEKVISQAFDTGGFGRWATLKYGTLLAKFKGSLAKRKGKLAQIYSGEGGMGILIRTGQLRRAFKSRVKMVR